MHNFVLGSTLKGERETEPRRAGGITFSSRIRESLSLSPSREMATRNPAAK
jgi:hypothetical protein